MLVQGFGKDVSKCKLMFGAKKVDKERTLFEQEIYHGSTVDLIFSLCGGMEKRNDETTLMLNKEHSSDEVLPQALESPKPLTTQKIQEWFIRATETLEIDIQEVSNFKSLDGLALSMLGKEDWIRRSPEYGDILFNMWRKDRLLLLRTEEKTLSTTIDKEREATDSAFNFPNYSRPNAVPLNVNSRKILFGKADAFDETEGTFLLKDFQNDDKSIFPQYGGVITISGVCLTTPLVQGNVATLFIRDDQKGIVSFYNKVKIVVIGGADKKNEINSLSKDLGTDMHMGVKGRVERLNEEDNVVTKDGYKMLRFKLVIDSDDHALFSREIKSPNLIGKLSQSWWPPHALSESGDELVLKVGDYLVLNVGNNVYCTVNTKPELILKHVVAFKNTFDGEILVGVTENGEITGMGLCSGEIKNWCDKISKAIETLLPRSNEGADIFHNIQEASNYVDRRRCFVCVLPLCNDKSKRICWIHVPKGEAKVFFTNPSDVHAFKRIGVENRRIKDYDHLFHHLESLAIREIEPIPEEDYGGEDDKQDEEKSELGEEYRILKEVEHENQCLEFKMIFGDNPVKTIQRKYLGPRACGLLNSEGGSIFFGIQKDEQLGIGHIVGIVLSSEERNELVKKAVKTLGNFYPPVSRNQFQIKFHHVCVPSDCIVRDKGGEKMYAMITGPSDEIGRKWPKFMKTIRKSEKKSSTVIPIRLQRFCVVTTKQTFDGINITELLEQFVKQNSRLKLLKIGETELETILKNICVIQLKINRSPYPIHMTKTIDTYVFTKDKKEQLRTCKLTLEDLMCRFKFDSNYEFNVDKFLANVNNFDNAQNSYILVTSPFYLLENERDLNGLVIPKWTLAIDLDQQPKQAGHLYQLFQTLNDYYHPERGQFLKTPQDSKLDLNPDHAVCWLAARGYQEDGKSLSEESFAKWSKTDRLRVRELLNEEVKTCLKPYSVNVVVLWDEGYDALVELLRTILEDLISLNGDDGLVVTFVCATPKASSDINSKIIVPLQEDNWNGVSVERLFVAPPYVLARFLSLKLQSPYRPEDDYQVPHKKYFSSGGAQIIPQILPQGLRQNLTGRIDVMYMKKGRKADDQKLNMERWDFFSGSAITNDGLHGNIAIRRTKISELEKHFKTLSHDKKSQVSLIFVKVDREAGSTTLCLQFLYELHKTYPCAQLIEIKDGLASRIDEINKKTKLPLVLFVDENIAHLEDFLDFKKEVERRNVSVIFILIEPAEVFFDDESLPGRKVRGQQITLAKSARDSFWYGPSPYKEVELRRRLDENEMEQLVKVLTKVTKGKKDELLRFKESARRDNKPRTFAQFSLLAFGSEFKGLEKYVKFRLTLADKRQQDILAFLSLTHVFTDCFFPANTLSHFVDKKTVELEKEVGDKYLQELLSPRVEGSDSRRISFYEVANEILKQLSATSTTANSEVDPYWNYIKDISVKMAKHVLSKYITTSETDGLTRKLFVTSEYESENFSLLIRTMTEKDPDTARDTLKELVEVFSGKDKQSSIGAHLRAHLAKYHMMQYEDFLEAKKLIEAAIFEQGDHPLLHHIHGEIIRLHVVVLEKKLKTRDDMETIVSYARESSACFELVRSKRPLMSHGFISDAMVRIIVMQAGIKLMGGKNVSFVDYLIERIDEMKGSGDEKISPNSRYLLSLISDAYECLDERFIDFERVIGQREQWKKTFLECIGDLNNLIRLCNKIQKGKDRSSLIDCSTWRHEMLLQVQILHTALEIENKGLSSAEIEAKLKKLEEFGFHSKFGDRFMKFWIRYSRQRLTVPNLQEVKRRVIEWSSKMKKKQIATSQAEFYNYVVHVLIAFKNPSDRENMAMAEKLAKQQSKKYNKKDFVLPLEWLQPKNGRHIESIDCLLYHDDLIKGTHISSTPGKRKSIEAFLFEKNISQWKGTISAISSEWQGTIMFQGHIAVRFVPQNAQPSMPSQGDVVMFCLRFDGFGLSAWQVIREAGTQPSDLSGMFCRDDHSSSEPTDAFHLWQYGVKRHKTHWDKYNEQRMQGVVSSTNPEMGFGFIKNPNIKGKLVFLASQLRVPVKNLKGNIVKDMLLDFKVEKLTERTRAADIQVLEDETPRELTLEKRRKKKQPLPSTRVRVDESDRRREQGTVVKYDDRGFGFIRRDNDKTGNNIFFSRRSIVTRGQLPRIGDRVEFAVTKDVEGRPEAVDILVQNKSVSSNSWDSFIGAGIQEGFVNSTTDDGGTINSSKVTESKKNLHFSNRDILNNPRKVCIGTKVHFEVRKRGGRCVAVKINIIDIIEEITQVEVGEYSFPSNDF